MIGITILVAVLVAGTAFGLVYRSRAGRVRTTTTDASPETRTLLIAAGASPGSTTVLHFSADWCGPCAAVRRVVGQVVDDVEGAVELELDIDTNPELARALGVLSLPTTFVLDERLVERARISGVPKAGDLRSTLAGL
ncbi:thioredoxin family protein [Rhodococcus sp. G-MC3]|uniref:thioredoxin family protein n=1 Tax=Rhodococcus sp. G-MC3 TaxID=3046209 RepID=UPI0024BB48FC|nr:thioredoxin family protein [Rhodococcus sp. G-MC3]MDJ0392621.1 thioredoxin family protein [Rhodococcus sp. G-MC3]